MGIHNGNIDDNEYSCLIHELGEKLRSIREAQRLSIDVVSDITKIQGHYLKAIEEGDLAKLPKGPYVRGFIRQYCEFLSAKDLWASYDELTRQTQSASLTEENELDYIRSDVFKASSHWWICLIILISLAAAAWITWNYRGEITNRSTNPVDGGTVAASIDRRANETVLTVSSVLPRSQDSTDNSSVDLSWMDGNRPAVEATTTPAALSEDTQQATQAPSEKNVVYIEASSSVWLSVSVGDQSLFRGTIKSGESKSFKVTNKAVRVRYGNPAGAAATWNGTTSNPVGLGSKPKTVNYHPDGKISEW